MAFSSKFMNIVFQAEGQQFIKITIIKGPLGSVTGFVGHMVSDTETGLWLYSEHCQRQYVNKRPLLKNK